MRTHLFILTSSVTALLALPASSQAPASGSTTPGANTIPLEEVVVTGSPLGRTLAEQTQPVNVLSGERLRFRLEPTIGETLNKEPGISSTYFGPGASRPVVRGLSDDRVRVLQNGVNSQDVSNVSPDHAVPIDPLVVDSLEVVRGPATLLYGPNTIGGVVNSINNRIPDERPQPGIWNLPLTGRFESRVGTVDEERSGSGVVEFGLGPLVFHVDGFTRETQDVHIPGFARSERLREREPLEPGAKKPRDVLPNSFTRSQGGAMGVSYVGDQYYLGLSYSGYNSRYGTVAEPDVTIDLHQRRFDIQGGWREPIKGIKEVRLKLGISDYNHIEYEGREVGTVFDQQSYDGRLELQHEKIGPLEGVIGFQTQSNDFSALGEEAFVPQVDTHVNSVFLFEEVVLEPWRFQAGFRYDRQTNDSDRSASFPRSFNREFDAFSASLGVVYNLNDTWNLALSGSYNERPPTYVELFAAGPHVATNGFEIGDASLGLEKSFAADLTVRKQAGRITGSASAFYYHFKNFIAENPTNGFVGDEEALRVFLYEQTTADFVGGEIEATAHLLQRSENTPPATSKDAKVALPPMSPHQLDLTLRADYVYAQDQETDRSLPRITPFRAGGELVYHYEDRFTARVDAQYSAHQNRIADNELATDSFVLLNASLSYKVPMHGVDFTFYVRGTNLLDEEARLHTSFLKDIAPLPGRGVLFGVRAEF